MGDGDQGCHEEVPKPHEPQRGRGGRAGPQSGRRGTPAQPQTPQHRVGPPRHRASGQSSTHTHRCIEIYKRKHLPTCCAVTAKIVSCTWTCRGTCGLIPLYLLCIIVSVDPGNQPDADVCERTFNSRPRGEKNGAVLNKCKFMFSPSTSRDLHQL